MPMHMPMGTLHTLQGEPVAGLGVAGNGPLVANISLVYMSVNVPRACTTTCERVVETDSFEFELVDAHGAASTNRAEVSISIIAGLDSTSQHFTVRSTLHGPRGAADCHPPQGHHLLTD